MSPDSQATATAWTRSRTASFSSRFATCVLIVARLTISSPAISAFERPRATRAPWTIVLILCAAIVYGIAALRHRRAIQA
jgi:hypothetical protein